MTSVAIPLDQIRKPLGTVSHDLVRRVVRRVVNPPETVDVAAFSSSI